MQVHEASSRRREALHIPSVQQAGGSRCRHLRLLCLGRYATVSARFCRQLTQCMEAATPGTHLHAAGGPPAHEPETAAPVQTAAAPLATPFALQASMAHAGSIPAPKRRLQVPLPEPGVSCRRAATTATFSHAGCCSDAGASRQQGCFCSACGAARKEAAHLKTGTARGVRPVASRCCM